MPRSGQEKGVVYIARGSGTAWQRQYGLETKVKSCLLHGIAFQVSSGDPNCTLHHLERPGINNQARNEKGNCHPAIPTPR